MKRLLLFTLALAACSEEDPPDPPPSFVSVARDYEPGALFSVWSSGPDDVWAVGGELGQPLVLHFDGNGWSRNEPPVSQQLWWVHGFPGGPVFVCGDGGALARWDGASWTVLDSGLPGTTLYGIWGAAPDDVWAVGGTFEQAPQGVEKLGDVITHFDGTRWSTVAVDALQMRPASAQKNLFKVWGASARDVFVVGAGGLALHYDGTAWRSVPTPIPGEPLFTVFGRSASDVFAVGGFGAGALLHWDGTAWSKLELPEETPSVLQGVWTAPGQPLWVSGHDGFVARQVADGSWAIAETDTEQALHAVWGDGQGVWAAGGNIVSFSPDYRGALLVSGRTVPALVQ